MLERAHDELKRMGDLLHNMLTFARPGGNERRETSIPDILERVVGLMRADFRGRGISIEFKTEPAVPTVWSRPERLQQVFMNLLLNARDAVRESARKSVVIRAWSTEQDVWVAFEDTGHGIPAAVRERIFDPFFTTKPPGEGTGMGLAVSRNIISDLNGDLAFESEEGQGARFSVRIPRGTPPQAG
jgi:signal transduction histidine kinase